MADKRTQQKVVDYLQDAHAMERAVLMMLNSTIFSTSDPVMVQELRRHREETLDHAARIQERLTELGAGASAAKQAVALGPTLMKGMVDQVRGDKPSKNARDGFITEHMEIATYQLIERLAERAGDSGTVAVARANRADEERMAKFLEANWDRVVDLTLEEIGVRLQPARPARSTGLAARRPARGTRRSGAAQRSGRRTAARATAG